MGSRTPDEIRLQSTERALLSPADPSHAGVLVGRVTTPTASIAVGKFLTVNPVTLFGPESEGGPGTLTTDTSVEVAVFLVGPRPAKQGELLLCRFVGHRWAAEHGGAPVPDVHTLLGCPCKTIPGTIALTVARQPAGVLPSFVFSATLAWGSKPADLSAYRADDPGYYSTDVLTSTDGRNRFRYRLGCSQGFYYVAGLMTPDSPLGFPGEFPIMRWLAGLPGNTCSPFRMHNGSTDILAYRALGITLDGGGSS